MIRSSLLYFLALVFFNGCRKAPEDNHCGWNKKNEVCMYFQETQCANPWDFYSTDEEEYLNKIEAYLESKGIEVLRILRKMNGPEIVCMACSCPSGATIYIQTTNSDVIKAENQGFRPVK
ncbi:MAG: hypothetical protein R3277_05290 [Brumimicrobium sp.]|nr:hypothetical protein [Brumimicrobium sp.]